MLLKCYYEYHQYGYITTLLLLINQMTIFAIKSTGCLVYEISNKFNLRFQKPMTMSSMSCLHCPQLKSTEFTVIEEKRHQIMFTF